MSFIACHLLHRNKSQRGHSNAFVPQIDMNESDFGQYIKSGLFVSCCVSVTVISGTVTVTCTHLSIRPPHHSTVCKPQENKDNKNGEVAAALASIQVVSETGISTAGKLLHRLFCCKALGKSGVYSVWMKKNAYLKTKKYLFCTLLSRCMHWHLSGMVTFLKLCTFENKNLL